MNNEICNLEPKLVWNYFYKLTQIPRPSKKESKVVEFVKKFGEDLGLETIIDKTNNVIIRKPATPGMENRKTICLQGHLDIVPQKNSNIQHDFEKDPLDPYIDGEWVTARDTTLGADNGIGLAATLAILESKDIEHGPLEALFTVDEETGMTGAFGLKSGILKADILINLDSEEEGELCIGCAGGQNTNITFAYSEENLPEDSTAYKISITGMKGGHSGMDIHLGRGNAIKSLNRIFYHTASGGGLRVAHINGGSLRNVIPREAFATVVIPNNNQKKFKEVFNHICTIIKRELANVEPDIKIELTQTDLPEKVMDEKTQNNLIKAIYGCPNGVIRMSDTMENLVETSSNLAVITLDKGVVDITSLQRSSVDSAKDDLCTMIRCIFELAGAKVVHDGRYPGWTPNPRASIVGVMKNVHKDLFGADPIVSACHGGLECGLFSEVYPNMEMISFGPDIRFPHSPDEKVKIDTVARFWDYLKDILKNIGNK
jgi:dipeptidase D